MHLSSDAVVVWRYGDIAINLTVVTTWGLMSILVIGAALVTRRLAVAERIPRWQGVLEVIVDTLRQQLREVGLREPDRHLGFLGTLFLFIALSNLCTLLPFYEPPTGSLSTTTALALCVFVSVPVYGIAQSGWRDYLRSYLQPTALMLPFNVLGELSRTLALAIRLFGNMMSGAMVLAILLSITPLLFPIAMSLLELLTGLVQAYIFTILATVYIAAATRVREELST